MGGGGGGGSVAEGVRWGGGVGGVGGRVDVNAMLGVGVMWGISFRTISHSGIS